MADEYEKAVLFVPDPTSESGWIRRKVWAEPAPRPIRAIGFAAESARRSQQALDARGASAISDES